MRIRKAEITKPCPIWRLLEGRCETRSVILTVASIAAKKLAGIVFPEANLWDAIASGRDERTRYLAATEATI
jgi:hypothetical protein